MSGFKNACIIFVTIFGAYIVGSILLSLGVCFGFERGIIPDFQLAELIGSIVGILSIVLLSSVIGFLSIIAPGVIIFTRREFRKK